MNPRRRRHNKRARRAVRLGVPGCPVRKFGVGDSKLYRDFLAMVGTLPEVLKPFRFDYLTEVIAGLHVGTLPEVLKPFRPNLRDV